MCAMVAAPGSVSALKARLMCRTVVLVFLLLPLSVKLCSSSATESFCTWHPETSSDASVVFTASNSDKACAPAHWSRLFARQSSAIGEDDEVIARHKGTIPASDKRQASILRQRSCVEVHESPFESSRAPMSPILFSESKRFFCVAWSRISISACGNS